MFTQFETLPPELVLKICAHLSASDLRKIAIFSERLRKLFLTLIRINYASSKLVLSNSQRSLQFSWFSPTLPSDTHIAYSFRNKIHFSRYIRFFFNGTHSISCLCFEGLSSRIFKQKHIQDMIDCLPRLCFGVRLTSSQFSLCPSRTMDSFFRNDLKNFSLIFNEKLTQKLFMSVSLQIFGLLHRPSSTNLSKFFFQSQSKNRVLESMFMDTFFHSISDCHLPFLEEIYLDQIIPTVDCFLLFIARWVAVKPNHRILSSHLAIYLRNPNSSDFFMLGLANAVKQHPKLQNTPFAETLKVFLIRPYHNTLRFNAPHGVLKIYFTPLSHFESR
jgi:hypothetical protein